MAMAQADPKIRHLQYIDALRGIAILGVICIHATQLTNPTGQLSFLMHFGANGVQLFYTISAFTLARSMTKRERVEANPTRNYLLRRFFRIAPTFYIVLALYCLIGAVSRTQLFINGTSLSHVLTVIFFLNGWRPDTINHPVVGQWSIAVEVLFYVLLPLIFPLIPNFKRAIAAWWISMGIFLVSFPIGMALARWEGFDVHDVDTRLFASLWFPSQLSTFIGGLGLFYILRDGIPLKKYLPPYLAGLVVLLCVRVFYRDTYLHPIYSVGFIVLAAFLSRRPIPLLVNRFTVFLGKVSFSAYLCHPLVLHFILPWLTAVLHVGPKTMFSVTLAFTMLLVCPISWLLWKMCEIPSQNMGHRIIGMLETERTATLPLITNG